MLTKAIAQVLDLALIQLSTLWKKPQGPMPTSLFIALYSGLQT